MCNFLNALFLSTSTSTNMAAIGGETLLKLENMEHLPEFLHECVNSLSKQNPTFDNNADSDPQWTQEELKITCKKIQNFFRQSTMNENLSLPNDLPEKVKNSLANVYKIRQKDILNSLIKENLVNSGHNLVENINWKLKWILGSSQLATIREPVCQVDLRCITTERNLTSLKRDVHFEANLEKIDKLISLLTNVKNELDDLENKEYVV